MPGDLYARQLSDGIARWAEGKWPYSDQSAKLRKLGEEYGELAEAMVNGDPNEIISEATDCMICLAHILHINGVSDFVEMMEIVFEERMNRDAD